MKNALQEYYQMVERFRQAKVGVIGDLIADMYIFGSPDRLSREAPIVVIEYESQELRPGGAANSAHNLAALGASVFPVGVVGDDKEGRLLKETLCRGKVASEGIFLEPGRETVTKTRIFAGDLHTVKQQMARIDKGKPQKTDSTLESEVLKVIGNFGREVSAWIISDYGYGFVTDKIREKVKEVSSDKIVVADSRYANRDFSTITAITPNESEALAFGRDFLNGEDDIFTIGEQILEVLNLRGALVTRGNKGMILFERGRKPVEIPIVGTEEIVDVSGAGDTVTATFALALSCGATFEQSANLANLAASVVVMKRGTATCSTAELTETVTKYIR
jgi:rfaE bifunctional protein kinase chain/domain